MQHNTFALNKVSQALSWMFSFADYRWCCSQRTSWSFQGRDGYRVDNPWGASQGLVHSAESGHNGKPLSLLLREVALELDIAADYVDEAFVSLFALLTVFDIGSVVGQLYGETCQVPSPPSGVDAEGYGSSAAEPSQQQVVGIWTQAIANDKGMGRPVIFCSHQHLAIFEGLEGNHFTPPA